MRQTNNEYVMGMRRMQMRRGGQNRRRRFTVRRIDRATAKDDAVFDGVRATGDDERVVVVVFLRGRRGGGGGADRSRGLGGGGGGHRRRSDAECRGEAIGIGEAISALLVPVVDDGPHVDVVRR